MQKTTTQAKDLLLERADDLQKVLDLVPEIIKVIKKFDGKVINKRLDTALKQVDPNLSAGQEWNSFIIDLRFSQSKLQGYRRVTIAHAGLSSAYGDGGIRGDNNTLKADALISDIEKTLEYAQKRIDKINKHLGGLDAILERYFDIKKQMSGFYDDIPHDVREVLELEFDLYKGRNY